MRIKAVVLLPTPSFPNVYHWKMKATLDYGQNWTSRNRKEVTGVVSGRGWAPQLPLTLSSSLRHQFPACSLFLYCLYFGSSIEEA